MPNVTFRNVHKKYPDSLVALGHLYMDIREGEFIVFLGPKGAGKTTLIRLLTGLETLTHGDVLVDGESIMGLFPRNRSVALISFNSALYPQLTVAENLAFGLQIRRKDPSATAERVAETAALLGLESLLDRLPAELTAFQQQQVLLGKAIVRGPKIFLLDEPLTGMDVPLRAAMAAELRRVQRALGAVFLSTTSDPAEAVELADRVAVLKDGYLQQCDTPERLYNEPANLSVANQLGQGEVNLFAAAIRGKGNDAVLAFGGGVKLPLSETALQLPVKSKHLVVGIRPEFFRPAGEESLAVAARVEAAEPSEAALRLQLTCGETDCTAILPAGAPEIRAGETVSLSVDPKKLLLFDGDTERMIKLY